MVPKALRYRAVDQAHVGNQGIFLSERLFREKFWFSGVGNMVKEKVESCLPCQAATTGKAERVKPRKDGNTTKRSMERTCDGFSRTSF